MIIVVSKFPCGSALCPSMVSKDFAKHRFNLLFIEVGFVVL